jgi:hypothetical protein
MFTRTSIKLSTHLPPFEMVSGTVMIKSSLKYVALQKSKKMNQRERWSPT